MSFGADSFAQLAGFAPPTWKEFEDLEKPQLLDHAQMLVALGVSPWAQPAVLQVVRRAHGTPYPPHWSEELDAISGALYFYHALRDEACWEHPLTPTFREVISIVEHCTANHLYGQALSQQIEGVLASAQELASEELSHWVGPLGAEEPALDGEPCVYYFNHKTGRSSWDDPRERHQYELHVRYELLVGFLVSEERGEVRAQGLQDTELTATLTTLASTIGSMVSTMSQPLPTELPASRGVSTGPPATPRFGGLKLPPKATDNNAGQALFTMPPHQQRYASQLQHRAPIPGGGSGGGGGSAGMSPAEIRGLSLPTPAIRPLPDSIAPPPPPPGAPPRWCS